VEEVEKNINILRRLTKKGTLEFLLTIVTEGIALSGRK
jgi:hypothetical protein